jgi:hypothetical protein
MRCGRCKALEVDIAHVRACYDPRIAPEPPVQADPPRPVERIVLEAPAVPARSTIGGDDHEEWWVADLQAASSLEMDVIGMDADGRSAWMRSVEDEYGADLLNFEMPPSSSYD